MLEPKGISGLVFCKGHFSQDRDRDDQTCLTPCVLLTKNAPAQDLHDPLEVLRRLEADLGNAHERVDAGCPAHCQTAVKQKKSQVATHS